MGAQFWHSGCGVPASPSWFSIALLRIMAEVMTLGLPQFCILWLGVSMGMLPVKYIAPKILKVITLNNCGCQLARWLRWVAPAYHKKEGAKFSLQPFYDELKYEWDMHSADNLVMCLVDFNGHVGRHIYGFDRVHGGYGRKNVIRVLSGE